MTVRTSLSLSLLLFMVACSSSSAPQGAAAAPPPPATHEELVAPAGAVVGARAVVNTPPPQDALGPGDGPRGRIGDVCGQIVVVAWRGADHAPESVTRSEAAASARAEALRTRIDRGEPFAQVATAESDAPSSRAHGGIMGTFAPSDVPPLHAALLPVFQALAVGKLGPVTRMPYGFVVPGRCEVRKVHVRHLLVRYAGAKNADASVTRTRAAAQTLAGTYRDQIQGGADFAQVAREHSEDGSAAQGGDLGWQGMGMFQPEFERAAFALGPAALSPVVETAFGFHVIQRAE